MGFLSVRSFWIYFGLATWLSLALAGIWKLNDYASKPGEKAQAMPQFPSLSKVPTTEGLPTLVLFLHPKCSCSVATMREFELLLPAIIKRSNVAIVFLKPDGFTLTDVHGPLWDSAKQIKGVNVMVDVASTESHLFGAKTSGQTFLYDGTGALVFEGGLTPSRGHMGEADGQKQILNFFSERSHPLLANAAVFGCALENKQASAIKDDGRSQ